MSPTGGNPGRASSSQYQSEFKALRDELSEAARTIARLEDKLAHATRLAEEEIASLTQRIGELEAEKAQLYAQLRDKAPQPRGGTQASPDHSSPVALKAELQRAQEERDRARSELKTARRYTRDLLNGRESLASSSPRSRYTTASSMASPRSTNTPRTPRPAHQPPFRPMSVPQGSTRPRSYAARVSTVDSDEDDQVPPTHGSNTASEYTVEERADLYENYEFQDGPVGQGDLEFVWRFYGLPAFARHEFGPMTKTEMVHKLKVDDHETLVQFNRITSEREWRTFRVVKWKNFAFVFLPILLESSTQTFMVDWMTPESATMIQQMIWGTDSQRAQTELHTFIDSPSEDEREAWYYVGMLRWSVSQLESQWPQYNKQIKETLAEILVERWRTALTPKDIGAMIEKESFIQFAIKFNIDDTLDTASRRMKEKLDDA